MKKYRQYFLLSLILFASALQVRATPFDQCPTTAFLFQSNNVQIYGVNLVTGSYSLLEDYVGINGNINGVGFNFEDRYIYGFNTSSYQVVRIGGDLQATELAVSGLPSNTTFFVGDVADNYYYVYRKNVGFYKINLDENRDNFMQAIKIDSADISLNLTDLAVHPTDNQIYAVDNQSGRLYRISSQTGASELLGDTGVTGTFGAGYFDVTGNYYIGRNNDGKIFRINLSDPDTSDVSAEFFAQGPSSNQNDGARCANAPISVDGVDWGDAPSSYSTSLADNGPRHQITEDLYLGYQVPDGEPDGLNSVLNDDDSNINDEDGVGFITAIEVGLDSLLQVTVRGEGFLNGWIDWNIDGQFDESTEKVFDGLYLNEGVHYLPYRVPMDAQVGSSWARFRLSSIEDLTPIGGAPNGEVEDYPISIAASNVTYRYYPSETGWVTLAYEDLWPKIGDYDMNDVVLRYRIVELIREDNVIRTDIHGSLVALGATYHNGFAVHLQNINYEAVDQPRLRGLINGEVVQRSFLEQGQSQAVIKISDDLWEEVASDCRFYRTQTSCKESIEFSFEVSVNFNQPIALADMPDAPYNPFIFATPYWGRDAVYSETPGRALEIHLADKPLTDLADPTLLGTVDDTSDVQSSRTFRTSNNLPWALVIGTDWLHPKETVDLLEAYPEFQGWIESGGVTNQDWYLDVKASTDKVYQ
ncbi:LruC domain-containing protein [Aliikangiella marina]|nr:LruC domain-containing protein [Aliikangiella marina]